MSLLISASSNAGIFRLECVRFEYVVMEMSAIYAFQCTKYVYTSKTWSVKYTFSQISVTLIFNKIFSNVNMAGEKKAFTTILAQESKLFSLIFQFFILLCLKPVFLWRKFEVGLPCRLTQKDARLLCSQLLESKCRVQCCLSETPILLTLKRHIWRIPEYGVTYQ